MDDYDAAEGLLTSAVEWLYHRHGLKRIWGPLDFDIWHGYRFMTRGFERQPFLGEPRNQRYYPAFFERFGFTVKAEWDSLEVTGPERIANMIVRGAKRFQLLKDRGYRFESMTATSLGGSDDRLHDMLTRTFSGFLGFTPLGKLEGRALLRRARTVFDPRLGLLVYNDANELAGFALACTEPGGAYRPSNGSLSLRSKLACRQQCRRFQTINFYLGGVTPEELKRRSGLGRAGFYAIIQNALDLGCETLLLTLRRKANHAHGLAARSDTQPQREYALYEWNHE